MKSSLLVIALLVAMAPQGRQQNGPPPVYRTEVPAHTYDIVAGQVTGTSAQISLLSYADVDCTLSWGSDPGKYNHTFPKQVLTHDMPLALTISDLKPGMRYYYQVRMGKELSEERTFVTRRPAGQSFTFSIQADSHLDGGTSPEVYLRSLAATRDTDFLIDLGDTFMTDKYAKYTDAHPQYVAQRYYFDQTRIPVYLVPGNHDGEGGRWRDGSSENMAIWSQTERKRYFPSSSENYWSFESGDALIIGLDPYWYTTGRGRRDSGDNWYSTLGKKQYDWLKTTLESSKARWKFVFIHNLVGGVGKDGRGGSEAAPFFEWGGKDADGTDSFVKQRPDWDLPIHSLLIKNGVSAVFHGHDHLFAYQERDGIIYQDVPQPGHGRGGAFSSAGEYGYKSGTILEGSGILKVTVGPEKAHVDFLRTDNTTTPVSAYSYDLETKKK